MTTSRPSSHTSQYVEIGRLFLPPLEVLGRHKAGTAEDFARDPRTLASVVSFRRQVESLQAALRLEEAGLGHLAVSFVRPAVEEVLWIVYLNKLSVDDARAVLIGMAADDALRSIQAELGHRGTEAMEHIGYPAAYLAALDQTQQENESHLKAVWLRLGYKGKSPNLKWIAEQADKLSVYLHLHPASSRAVHFSAGEIFRRAWFDGETRSVRIDDPAHRGFLRDFAFDQLIRMCVFTLVEIHVETASPPEEVATADAVLSQLFKDLVLLGEVPLSTPEEMNLPQGPVPPPRS